MKPSSNVISMIKRFEGFSPNAYTCAGGKRTIGYGHVTDNIKSITEDDATKILIDDVSLASRYVNELVKVKLTQNQFDALVSFVFNIGHGALAKSRLLAAVNKGDHLQAAAEFLNWVYASGKPLKGLLLRRMEECKLYIG